MLEKETGKMKKTFVIIAAILVMVITLCACGESFTCSICGRVKNRGKHTVGVPGMQVVLCDDCYKAFYGR